MLNRLCIGLAGEGAQVTRIVPDAIASETVLAGEERMALLPRIETAMDVLPWTRQRRAEQLASSLEAAHPDVLYAVGQKAQAMALDLAAILPRPVAVDLWSMDQVRQIRQRRSPEPIAGYIVPTESMASSLRERVGSKLVHVVPLGVATPRAMNPARRDQIDEPTVAVVGSARDMPAYEAVLSGLSRVAREIPTLQIFLELRGPHEHDIWRHAKTLDLLRAISTLGEAAQYRALLTRCDLMLMPERFGEVRSLVLEAMALGVPIIASQDSQIDSLVPDQAAVFVRQTEPDAWAQEVRRLLTDAEEARMLGLRGRQAVLDRHGSSLQVSRLLEALEIVAGPPLSRSDRTKAERQA